MEITEHCHQLMAITSFDNACSVNAIVSRYVLCFLSNTELLYSSVEMDAFYQYKEELWNEHLLFCDFVSRTRLLLIIKLMTV